MKKASETSFLKTKIFVGAGNPEVEKHDVDVEVVVLDPLFKTPEQAKEATDISLAPFWGVQRVCEASPSVNMKLIDVSATTVAAVRVADEPQIGAEGQAAIPVMVQSRAIVAGE